MKVLQTIGGFGAHSGGTSTCTYDLISAMHEVAPEYAPDLLTPEVNSTTDKLMGHGEEWIKAFPNDNTTPLAYSRNALKTLAASDAELYHTNGMWMHINHATCTEARRKHKPYIITPHGMLYPEAMARSRWKKAPVWHLWYKRDVMQASCIHVTCEDELRHVRNLGYRGPIALIGNPVPVSPDITDIFEGRANSPFLGCNLPKKLGFLGRLHPIKKCEALLYGVALRPKADVGIVIMGKGSDEYEEFLHSEAQRLGIADRVEFVGFVNGREKYERLAHLSALFVPSDMENFGMIIPEALLVGTPVMASLGTPWKTLNDNRCGWWTGNTPEDVARVIDEVCSRSPKELFDMGARGREMVLANFEATQVAHKMAILYEWVLNGGDRPEFVSPTM